MDSGHLTINLGGGDNNRAERANRRSERERLMRGFDERVKVSRLRGYKE